MHFTLDQLRTVTVGAPQIWQEADGFHFCKMTAGQLAAFDRISEGIGKNARATTGIRIDFWTDAPYVRYCTLTDGKYECKRDGLLIEPLTAEAGSPLVCTLPQDGALHRFTLHLPSHGPAGGLAYLALPDGARVEPHHFDRKFLFIGDSITQGWKSETDTCSYAYLVSDHFNAESVIQGTGSACYVADTLERIDFDPDTVFVAYGTNDANGVRTLEEMHDRCEAFLKKVRTLYTKAEIVVLTPLWCVNYDVPRVYGHVSEIGKTIAAVATSLEMRVIAGEEMIPCLPSLFIDNVHPNPLGFAFYAHNLIKALRK